MKRTIIFLTGFLLPLLCLAQSPLTRQYSYDASGNRTTCAIINLPSPPPPAPPTPPDSTESDELRVTSYELRELSNEYFVEKIGQTEIKIYPNPTTEKITLEFSGPVQVENVRPLRLYSLSGQLLQEQPVHSPTTIVSLAGFAHGVYILKVQINDHTEDWKVIKN